MEGTASETIFDSLNLNPKLFINEVLNIVDDVVDDAFDFFYQEASAKLKIDGTERSQDLKRGIDCVRDKVQSVLDKRLSIWEMYCLRHCFSVPQGFSLPKNEEAPGNSSMNMNVLCDADLDAQLDSLRKNLIMVGEESQLLNQELKALEKQSTLNNHCAGLINDALQLYKTNHPLEMFQEMVRMASELGIKLGKMKSNMVEKTESAKLKRICMDNKDLSMTFHPTSLSTMKVDELEEFADMIKNT